MKYTVSRTSNWSNETPCKVAVQEQDEWVIEIKDLEELTLFVRNYGEVIIQPKTRGDNYAHLEIYDDYRE